MRKYSFVLNGLTEQFFLPGIAYYTEKTSAKRCGRRWEDGMHPNILLTYNPNSGERGCLNPS